MKNVLNAVVSISKNLGFRTANGTKIGVRGFSIIDGFGRVKFVSFRTMLHLCASINNFEKCKMGLGKTFKTPFFDYHRGVNGSLMVVFKDDVSLFFDSEKVSQSQDISNIIPHYLYKELQYVKNKNSKSGPYVRGVLGYPYHLKGI